MIEGMTAYVLKEVRRTLPIGGVKFHWNFDKLKAHKALR
jgi:hypothetical protein